MTIMTPSPATASERWQVDGGLGGQELLGEDEHGDHRAIQVMLMTPSATSIAISPRLSSGSP
jgi:hypothetical protein